MIWGASNRSLAHIDKCAHESQRYEGEDDANIQLLVAPRPSFRPQKPKALAIAARANLNLSTKFSSAPYLST